MDLGCGLHNPAYISISFCVRVSVRARGFAEFPGDLLLFAISHRAERRKEMAARGHATRPYYLDAGVGAIGSVVIAR